MKKFTLVLILVALTKLGFPQFLAMPLNYPWDTSAYISCWTSIIDENTVWVGTARQRNHGYIPYANAVRTTDGGNTWQFLPIPVPGTPWIQHLSAWDANICYYLFTDGISYGGSVWKTEDGGTTWVKKTTTQFIGGWGDVIHAFTADTVVALGDPTGGYFEIQLTWDGGNTWTRIPASDMPPALTAETGTSGEYCAAGNSIWFPTNKGRCFYSSDRGAHWAVSQISTGYISVCFSDEFNGIAFEAGMQTPFYHSNDGGATWHQSSSSSLLLFGYMSRVPGITGGYVATTFDTTSVNVYFTPDSFTTLIQLDSNIHNASRINFKSSTIGWLGGSYNPHNDIHKFIGVLTGLKEKSQTDDLMQIVPNPSNREALVKIPKKYACGNSVIRILDAIGKQVFDRSYDTSSGWIKLDASSYRNGVYLIELRSKYGITTSQKWIIQH